MIKLSGGIHSFKVPPDNQATLHVITNEAPVANIRANDRSRNIGGIDDC